MLCTNAYTPNIQTHQYKSSITNEVVGTGYTAGGVTLTPTVSYTASPFHVTKFAAADAVWASSTITARYAVVYDSTPSTDATRPLICYIDFGVDIVTVSSTFSISWGGSGGAGVIISLPTTSVIPSDILYPSDTLYPVG